MKIFKEDIEAILEEWIKNCDGVIMSAREADYLHNFAVRLRGKMQKILWDIEDTPQINSFTKVCEQIDDD